jgi:toxin ParE1/3/4
VKRIVPRGAAERDIDEAADYYTEEAGEDVAHGFIETLHEAYRAISEHPSAGSPRYTHLLGIPGLRTRKLGRFPFLVFYIEHEDHIDVWRVLHARRDIPASLGEAAG